MADDRDIGGSVTMPDTLSREKLAAIRERDASALHGDEDSADYMVCVTDREALLAHIDALTAAVGRAVDEQPWDGSSEDMRASVYAILRGEQ